MPVNFTFGGETTGSDPVPVPPSSSVLGITLNYTFEGEWPSLPQPAPADISVFVSGNPDGSEVVNVGFTRIIVFAAELPGSFARAATAATATVIVDINQVSGIVSILRGTLTMSAGQTDGAFSLPAPIVIVPGDEISFAFPALPDATLADLTIALRGTQT